MIAIRGAGGGVYASVIAEVVDADAGAGEDMLDASPMARTAINAVTAPLMDRVTRHTRESCRKNRLAHSRIAEPTTAHARWGLVGFRRGRDVVGAGLGLGGLGALIQCWVACRN